MSCDLHSRLLFRLLTLHYFSCSSFYCFLASVSVFTHSLNCLTLSFSLPNTLSLSLRLFLPLPLVSVKELRSAGFSPDFIVCRAKKAIEVSSKNKISLFCNVDKENVLSIPDVSNIYHVPLLLLQQDFHHLLSKKLNLNAIQQEKLRVLAGVEAGVSAVEEESKEIIINKALVKSWEDMVVRIDSATDDVSIALIGKYTNQQDSYLSVISALKHSCIATDQKLKLLMIESSSLEQETKEKDPALFEAAWKSLKSADGILVPGTAHEHCAFIASSSSFYLEHTHETTINFSYVPQLPLL